MDEQQEDRAAGWIKTLAFIATLLALAVIIRSWHLFVTLYQMAFVTGHVG